MTDDSDIKELLGRALTEEPPMRLDRGEIFRQGRKRLRRRRLLEAGGVVAGVMVIAVGAITLTGPRHDDRGGIPAADGGGSEPPSPTVLVSPEPPAPPSVTDSPLVPTDQHAQAMTVALTEYLPPDLALRPLPGVDESGFRPTDGVYQLAADVVGPEGEGSLQIAVAPGKADDRTDCVVFADDYPECELVDGPAEPVALATERFANGEQRYVVYVARTDGTTVNAVITNLSEQQRAAGEWPSVDPPVLSQAAFAELATLPGLTFYY